MKACLRALGVVLTWIVLLSGVSQGQRKTLLETYKGPLEVSIVYNSGTVKKDRIVAYDGRLQKIQLGATTINLPKKVTLERGGHLQKWWSRDSQARAKFPTFPTEPGLYSSRLVGYYKQRFPAEVSAITYSWPQAMKTVHLLLSNEQYEEKNLQAARPYIYRAIHFHEIPPTLFPIHDYCLTFAEALLAMEQFNEAFNLLFYLNLSKLDGYGYREFSEVALNLAGKMIAANPGSAKHVQTLLAKVNIRDDSADHQAYLDLCDALRHAEQYNEAVSEYGRLQAVLARSPGSPIKNLVGIWPIYCRFKQSEGYMINGAKYAAAAANPSVPAAQKAQYAAAAQQLNGYANQFFNAAEQPLLKLAESPPSRQSNEYSLYKLLRAIHKELDARRKESLTKALQAAAQQAAAGGRESEAQARMAQAASSAAQAVDSRRQSVLEVTEGIVMARVGLDWLPESLLMAGDAYAKLAVRQIAEHENISASGRTEDIEKSRKSINGYLEAARNVYDQVDKFFKGRPVAAEALKLKAALPAGV